MPVEIRELVIRTVVAPSRDDDEQESGGGSGLAQDSLSGQDAVVAECVRQVLRILRKERER